MLFAQDPDIAVALFFGRGAPGDVQYLCLYIMHFGIYDNVLSGTYLLAGFGRFAVDPHAVVVAGALGLGALFYQTRVLEKKIETCHS